MKGLLKLGKKKDKEKEVVTQPSPKKDVKPEAKPSKSHYHLNTRHHHNSQPQIDVDMNALGVSTLEEWNSNLPTFESLPSFKDVPASERGDLFQKKLKACERMYFWQEGAEGDEDSHSAEKELKRKQLIELLDFINQNQSVFSEQNMPLIMEFVSINLFRGLPANPTPPHIIYDPEEDEPMNEPSWPHLQFVMEFFLRFIVSSDVDPKVARKYVDQAFIVKLLALFDSEDVRERDFLKTILHRMYGKFMPHRPFIRKAINNTFYHFAHNTERHNGIAELLEILGSIINGFALPLKDEHKQFLQQALMPLHKVKYMSTYHTPLSYCINQFCMKDATLTPVVIHDILKFWPVTNSPKEVLYLSELEDILDITPAPQFEAVLDVVFRRIALCIKSYHFQVSERALLFWHNDVISAYIGEYRRRVLPIIFPALMGNIKGHWNPTVHQLTVNVVKSFNDMDPKLFEECAVAYRSQVEQSNQKRKHQIEQWQTIETAAVARSIEGWTPPSIVQSIVSQQDAFVVDTSKLNQMSLSLPNKRDSFNKSRFEAP